MSSSLRDDFSMIDDPEVGLGVSLQGGRGSARNDDKDTCAICVDMSTEPLDPGQDDPLAYAIAARARMKHMDIPPNVHWQTFLEFYYTQSWKSANKFTPSLEADFEKGNTKTSRNLVELIMQPLAVELEVSAQQPELVNNSMCCWDDLLPMRLERCGIQHCGLKEFPAATGKNCPHGMAIEVFYIGWRYFMVVVLARSATSSSSLGLRVLGFFYFAIPIEQALALKFDA